MQFWNNIIQNAMLGTSKKQLAATELNDDLANVLSAIKEQQATDAEEQFLQLVAIASNYRQSGAMPAKEPVAVTTVAEAETYPYCTEVALQLLKDILEEDSYSLLNLWLRLCSSSKQIVHPAIIPKLLAKASQHKALRNAIFFVVGKRGAWLCQFNKNWSFSAAESDEELWQSGTSDQRRQVLQNMRLQDHAKASEWLQQTWKQENANTKVEFLKIIGLNPQETDVAWLETLLTDKSQKVKDEALNVLKQIPSSAIIQQYWQIMKQAISIVTEKTMLGLSSKKALKIELPQNIDESIFKSGIEKLSSQKNISDEVHIMYQLMALIPPSSWEEQLQETPEHILSLFGKSDTGKALVPAIGLAAGRFKNKAWARLFLDDKEKFYPDLLPLISRPEQEQYLMVHFDKDPHLALSFFASNISEEWSLALATKILRHTVKNIYQYNRAFYEQHIQQIPSAILPVLDTLAPTEEYYLNSWNNIKDHISKLINLKQRTIDTFHHS
ncbi:MAG: DUF5691 domain-containing protein [Bacteroidota bacterium]